MLTENTTPKPDTFYVGLCMAGAVSAGAYTAGVMDYLIEALEEWQKRKDANIPGTPTHNVVIPVIGGASAGGMTGIITASALNNEIKPVKIESLADDIMKEQPQNKFYHSWVDLIDKDMFPLMLSTTDIEREKSIGSLLNSDFIKKVADRVVGADTENWKELPPYFAKNLKIFTTLTNLEGFSYDVTFKANIKSNKYYMAIHNDYACFQLNVDAKDEDPSTGWMPLNFKTGRNVQTAKDSAMATGAFPVGLQSRVLTRESVYVNNIPWLTDITYRNPVAGENYKTQNIDGGTINNEPFEKVRDVLDMVTWQSSKDEYESFNRFKSTVLMIDPFPSEKSDSFKINLNLFSTVGKTLSAVISQMRAKKENLVKAFDITNAGQYLISPTRTRPKLDGTPELVQGEKAIACGAFDGFSGFINKEFRVHDYFLGRANCEKFLRKYFTVPASALNANTIFKNGYSNVDLSQFASVEADGSVSYPIIPLFTKESDTMPMPIFSSGNDWPSQQDEAVERFRPLMKNRVQAMILNAAKINVVTRFFLWAGARLILNKMLSSVAINTIKKALNEHELLPKTED